MLQAIRLALISARLPIGQVNAYTKDLIYDHRVNKFDPTALRTNSRRYDTYGTWWYR